MKVVGMFISVKLSMNIGTLGVIIYRVIHSFFTHALGCFCNRQRIPFHHRMNKKKKKKAFELMRCARKGQSCSPSGNKIEDILSRC